jgi:hypothetical protein
MTKQGLEVMMIPRTFAEVIDRRTTKFLAVLPQVDYDLRAVLRAAYTQGLTDMMQLIQDRPLEMIALFIKDPKESPQ